MAMLGRYHGGAWYRDRVRVQIALIIHAAESLASDYPEEWDESRRILTEMLTHDVEVDR